MLVAGDNRRALGHVWSAVHRGVLAGGHGLRTLGHVLCTVHHCVLSIAGHGPLYTTRPRFVYCSCDDVNASSWS